MLNHAVRHALGKAQPALSAAGIAHLAVFGSQARGEAGPDSDLDILIDIKDDTTFSLLDLIGIEQLLTGTTGIKVNALMRRSLEPAFRARITPDVVEVF